MVSHFLMDNNALNMSQLGNTSSSYDDWFSVSTPEYEKSSGVPFSSLTIPRCEWILYKRIGDSRVKIWDVIILIPNSFFLFFLLCYSRAAVAKLKASSSPIFTVFYGLVCAVSVISVLRCIVSMTVNATVTAGDYADKILWLILRFFLLATELSVVIFGLAFGHLDSRTSIQRVLIVTFSIAFCYSVIQGVLEFEFAHQFFKQTGNNETNHESYDLFAHGGMIFLFTTSIFFFIVYSLVIVLPFTKLSDRFLIPTKRLFYYYCGTLALLNLCQAIASILLYEQIRPSMCVVDGTTLLYFTLFNPLVYGVFLWNFFKVSQAGLQFSYKHQDDVIDDEHVSLPYSNGVTKHDDRAPIYSYDSTHFDVQFSPSINSDAESGSSYVQSFPGIGNPYDSHSIQA